MRQIILDTETTGLETAQGHRVIELGCVELLNRRLTGNHFHYYLAPDRDIDLGAEEVHGITKEFLKDKPKFRDVVDEFMEFARGAEIIIHNAPFDVGFLNYELELMRSRWGRFEDHCTIIDTLALAREKHPGQRNSLDALCQRYHVDNSQRELHGALLDAEILAEVYLLMTGGQASLELAAVPVETLGATTTRARGERPRLKVLYASPQELADHAVCLDGIEKSTGDCFWKYLELAPVPVRAQTDCR